MKIGPIEIELRNPLQKRSTSFGTTSTITDEQVRRLFPWSAQSSSGEPVTPDTALTLSHIYQGTRLIAEGLASLPQDVFKRTATGRERQPEHPIQTLVHDQASPLFNAGLFREAMITSAILRGNGYAIIERNPNTARPIAMHFVDSWKAQPFLYQGRRWYKVDGMQMAIPNQDMIHIPGFGFDGLRGRSFIQYAADSLGVGLASQKFGGLFFKNGANLGGILSTDKELTDEATARLVESWNQRYTGGNGALGTALLQDGMTYTRIGVAPNEAQFIETRALNVEEGARWLNVPLSKLKALDKTSYNSQEQQNIEWVQDTLRPWAVKWEQEMNNKLFMDSERATYYVKINLNGLLRGDQAARSEYIKTLLDRSIITINEARALDDMNPTADGDRRLWPVNMLPADKVDEYWLDKKTAATTRSAVGFPVMDLTDHTILNQTQPIE
jgi:HK97 family phage portal protein